MAIKLKKKDLEQKTASANAAQGAGPGNHPAGLTPFSVEEKRPSYVAFGILGILAVLMFAGLLFIQWIEWSEYNKPGIFPSLTAKPAPAGGAPAASEAPAEETPAADTEASE